MLTFVFHGRGARNTVLLGKVTNPISHPLSPTLSPTLSLTLSLSLSLSRLSPSHYSGTENTIQFTPGPPQSLEVVPVTSSSLRLNWEQPIYPNGLIEHYIVYYQCTNVVDCPLLSTEVQSQSENPTYLLTDLHEYTEYKVYVAAVTGAGEGQPSSNRVEMTLEDKPDGPPLSVHGEADSSTSILMSWAPPEKRRQCGQITKYRLTYKGLYSRAAPPVVSCGGGEEVVGGGVEMLWVVMIINR
eukprot:sb/3469040/